MNGNNTMLLLPRIWPVLFKIRCQEDQCKSLGRRGATTSCPGEAPAPASKEAGSGQLQGAPAISSAPDESRKVAEACWSRRRREPSLDAGKSIEDRRPAMSGREEGEGSPAHPALLPVEQLSGPDPDVAMQTSPAVDTVDLLLLATVVADPIIVLPSRQAAPDTQEEAEGEGGPSSVCFPSPRTLESFESQDRRPPPPPPPPPSREDVKLWEGVVSWPDDSCCCC